jgi:hypothetical protein
MYANGHRGRPSRWEWRREGGIHEAKGTGLPTSVRVPDAGVGNPGLPKEVGGGDME